MLDMLSYVIGAPAKSVSVAALADAYGRSGPDDNLVATISYEDRSVGVLAYTSVGHPGASKESLAIHTLGHSIEIDDYSTLSHNGARVRRVSAGKGHVEEMEEFARVARGERQSPWSLEELETTSRLAIQIQREAGGPESVDRAC